MGFMIIFAYNSAHNLHKTNLTAQKKNNFIKSFVTVVTVGILMTVETLVT